MYMIQGKRLRCRAGYPVPVGNGGGKAGPARSSTSNCREPLVGNQAGALVSDTGMSRRRENGEAFTPTSNSASCQPAIKWPTQGYENNRMIMESNKGTSLRCRIGNPVPVGNGGGKAGPTRPSANDCREPLVGNQAGALVPMTGMGTRKKKSVRNAKGAKAEVSAGPVLRLKGGAASSSSSSGDESDSRPKNKAASDKCPKQDKRTRMVKGSHEGRMSADEFIGEPIGETTNRTRNHSVSGSNPFKRKATSPVQTKVHRSTGASEMAKQLTLLDAALSELNKFIKDNKNVHVGVKTIVSRINTYGYEVQRAHAKTQRFHDDLVDEKEELSFRLEVLEKRLEKGGRKHGCKTAEAATQTRTQSEAMKATIAEEIRARLTTVKGIEYAGALFEETWPEETYKRSSLEEGSPMDQRDNNIILAATEEELSKPTGLARQVADRFPELFEETGVGVSHIKVDTSVVMNGMAKRSERNIFKLALPNVSQESILEGLLSIKENLVTNGCRTVHLPKITGVDATLLRKLVELAWLGEDLRCVIHVRRIEQGTTSGRTSNLDNAKPRERDKVVFVATAGSSYKDVLAKVRGSLIEGKEDKVRSIRQTKGGELLIVLNKDADSDRVRNTVAAALPEVKVTARGGPRAPVVETTASLLIQGMDELTSEKEIAEAIQERTGDGQVTKVGLLRKGFGGTMTATVRVPKEVAERVLLGGRIGIGPVSCKIRESVTLRPCLKCHSYEHQTAGCSRRGGARTCHNCGEAGHVRKDCGKESHCVVCKKGGHSAHTGKCPAYRKALRTAIKSLPRPARDPDHLRGTEDSTDEPQRV